LCLGGKERERDLTKVLGRKEKKDKHNTEEEEKKEGCYRNNQGKVTGNRSDHRKFNRTKKGGLPEKNQESEPCMHDEFLHQKKSVAIKT